MKLMDFIFFKSITQTELCSQKIFAEYFQKQILNFWLQIFLFLTLLSLFAFHSALRKKWVELKIYT